MNGHRLALELVARVLIRSFLGGVVLLYVWFFLYIAMPGPMHAVNAHWFAVTPEQFDFVMFCSLAALKIFLITVFLIPYIAIRLVLRRKDF